jgi:hypothetical protein
MILCSAGSFSACWIEAGAINLSDLTDDLISCSWLVGRKSNPRKENRVGSGWAVETLFPEAFKIPLKTLSGVSIKGPPPKSQHQQASACSWLLSIDCLDLPTVLQTYFIFNPRIC